MVGHEEGVEAATLQRLRESLQVREIEIRIRKRSRVAPRGGVDTDRPHERTEAQLSLASHATSPADRWLASLGILEMMQSSRLDDIINRMLSHKSKYALEALLVLSEEYGNGPLLISEIAKREHIPKRFLELILLELKNHGVLRSKKGKGGGYTLSKPPDLLSVGLVLRMLEGPLAPLPCVSKTAYEKCAECRDERTCGIRLLMKDVRDATAAILDSTTFADVLKRSRMAGKGERALMYSI
jgi:Rrf2 family protein